MYKDKYVEEMWEVIIQDQFNVVGRKRNWYKDNLKPILYFERVYMLN